MEIDRVGGGSCLPPFPVYENLVEDLVAAHKPTLAERNPTVAHLLGCCAGYAYSDTATVAMMMTRLGLEANACVRIAHRVKGSSGMVGARDLAAACETMEHAAQQDGAEAADGAKAAIDRALQRLEAHLAAATSAPQDQSWP